MTRLEPPAPADFGPTWKEYPVGEEPTATSVIHEDSGIARPKWFRGVAFVEEPEFSSSICTRYREAPEMVKDVLIREGEGSERQAIAAVLECCGLPSDIATEPSCFFHVALLNEQVVACARAEQCGETIVVRSVGVLPDFRGHHIATSLIGSVLTRARAQGCTKAVLITAGRFGLPGHYDVPLVELESMPEALSLSDALLRRFRRRRNLNV
jgi:amino-acid N-acetyltransferase